MEGLDWGGGGGIESSSLTTKRTGGGGFEVVELVMIYHYMVKVGLSCGAAAVHVALAKL